MSSDVSSRLTVIDVLRQALEKCLPFRCVMMLASYFATRSPRGQPVDEPKLPTCLLVLQHFHTTTPLKLPLDTSLMGTREILPAWK